jgi:2-polyprenyl-3-methyl-5-hydroxy-6-metoxy-1,4-benzoquinol methylase
VGEQKNSNWYNEAFETMPMYQTHYTGIGYYGLWKELIKHLDKKERIIELACGVGQLAHMLHDKGYDYRGGYDFSEKAIDEARKRSPLPFYLKDLLSADIKELTNKCDVVIMCEFLEHIEDDIELIKKINKKMIITLPDFDGTSHVRHFVTKDQVLDRYSPYLEIDYLEKFTNHYLIIGRSKHAN